MRGGGVHGPKVDEAVEQGPEGRPVRLGASVLGEGEDADEAEGGVAGYLCWCYGGGLKEC